VRGSPTIDVDGLLDSLAERVAAKLEDRWANGHAVVNQRLYTVDQAAIYLGRTKESVHHLISGGRLPTVRIDRRVFLDKKELDQLIEESKVDAV